MCFYEFSLCGCVSCAFSLFSFSNPGLFSFCFLQRERWRAVGWVSGEMGSTSVELGEGNCDQNILYEKIFSKKRHILKTKINENPLYIHHQPFFSVKSYPLQSVLLATLKIFFPLLFPFLNLTFFGGIHLPPICLSTHLPTY